MGGRERWGWGGGGEEMLVAFINEGFTVPRKKRGGETLEGTGYWEPADRDSGPK